MTNKFETISLWIQSDVNIDSNPKLRDLADILETPKVHLLGHLHAFWHYAFKHFNDGYIFGRNLETKIATEGAQWAGEAVKFVNALVECRFLHRSEHSTEEECDECFGSDANGHSFPLLQPGGYVIHGWGPITYYWRLLQTRKQIKRQQDATRQADKRLADKEKGQGKSSVVKERPDVPYQAMKRGLRAAPSIVNKDLRAALENVILKDSHAKNNVTYPITHADKSVTSREKLRDVTLDPQNTLQNYTPQNSSIIGDSEKTNTMEYQVDSHETRDITQKSPHTYKQTKKPSFKDTSLSLSSQDEESLKDGARGAPSVEISNSNQKDLPDQKVISVWNQLYLKATGDKCPEDLGRLGRARSTWNKRNYSNQEIVRRIELFFESNFEDPTRPEYAIGEFQKQFVRLEAGPVKIYNTHAATRRSYGSKTLAHGGEDFRTYKPGRDDFGPDN